MESYSIKTLINQTVTKKTHFILDGVLGMMLRHCLCLGGYCVRPALVVIVEDWREGRSWRNRYGLRRRLGHYRAAKVASLVPLLEHLNRQMDELPLALLPAFDELQQGHGPDKVPPQLEHLLVGHLVVFPVLARLHLFGASSES